MARERIREDMIFVKEQLELAVHMNSEQGYQTIVQIADMPYVRALAEGDNELEIVELLVRIHKCERQEGVMQTILSKADNFESLMEVYYRVLFGLQRIWFELEKEYQKEFIAYLQVHGITPFAVYMILDGSRIDDKKRVWDKVTHLWENYHE